MIKEQQIYVRHICVHDDISAVLPLCYIIYCISLSAFLNWNENNIAVKVTAIISATGSAMYTAYALLAV